MFLSLHEICCVSPVYASIRPAPPPQHTHTHTHTHTQARTHARTQTHTHMHAHTHTQTDRHTCTYTLTHRNTHTHTHTNACTHTYTLTPGRPFFLSVFLCLSVCLQLSNSQLSKDYTKTPEMCPGISVMGDWALKTSIKISIFVQTML